MTDNGFTEFWALYPKKNKKQACIKKYGMVRKKVAHETLMAGLRRYMANKEDWCPWADPLTWLNQGRWEDEYSPTGGAQNEHRPRPTPQYLRDRGRRRVVPKEDKERVKARMDVHDQLRREGIDPFQMDPDEYHRRIATRLAESENAQ